MYQRPQVDVLIQRMQEHTNPLIQVVVGPRQTGKSTMVTQALRLIPLSHTYVSADEALEPSEAWLQTEWQQARNEIARTNEPMVLAIDEIQKVPHWPTVVKALWDADQRENLPLKVVLSGSSSLLLHEGLEESLMGRFELIRSPHWSLAECEAAFGFSFEQYLYFGGYPGAARFVDDESRWKTYMRDAIIEPTISQDVLALEEIRKPALMRALFRLGATYSGQELSYTKMLGQLRDAGNTTTLAHYLELLDKAGILANIPKFNPAPIRRQASPRLMVYDTSLMTAVSEKNRMLFSEDRALRGHLVETAVGARLLARSAQEGFDLFWWRDGNFEVDFVLAQGEALTAIEVKSGSETRQSGMAQFLERYPQARRMVVGGSAAGAYDLEAILRDEVDLF